MEVTNEKNKNSKTENLSKKDDESIQISERNVQEEKLDWALKIPKIDLYAGIKDATDDETLNTAIGHFEESEIEFGNVCLAAHNRGYNVNYFENIKNLEIGDIIYYIVNDYVYEYKVSEILVIYETDWSMLENTKDNRITLITCIENREEYRLCVQAIEI